MKIELSTEERSVLTVELDHLMGKINLLYERYTGMRADNVHYHEKIERLKRLSRSQ